MGRLLTELELKNVKVYAENHGFNITTPKSKGIGPVISFTKTVVVSDERIYVEVSYLEYPSQSAINIFWSEGEGGSRSLILAEAQARILKEAIALAKKMDKKKS